MFSRVFRVFLVLRVVAGSLGTAESELQLTFVPFSQLLTEKHYRVRGKASAFPSYYSLFPCFLVFFHSDQACPLITLSKRAQKVSFGHKRQLLVTLSQSDEWGRLNLIPRSCFSREKHTISYRRKWCIPFSFSDRKSCVKGGVFFPIEKSHFSCSGSVRIRSGPF